MLNRKLLEEIAIRLQFALVKELLDQGHKATGRLYKSVKVVVLERVQEWILEGSFIKSANFDSLNYSQDSLATITVSIQMDRCVLIYWFFNTKIYLSIYNIITFSYIYLYEKSYL